jgi:hypothetical protein
MTDVGTSQVSIDRLWPFRCSLCPWMSNNHQNIDSVSHFMYSRSLRMQSDYSATRLWTSLSAQAPIGHRPSRGYPRYIYLIQRRHHKKALCTVAKETMTRTLPLLRTTSRGLLPKRRSFRRCSILCMLGGDTKKKSVNTLKAQCIAEPRSVAYWNCLYDLASGFMAV